MPLPTEMPPWVAAVNGNSKRPWFVTRQGTTNLQTSEDFDAWYLNDKNGDLIRFKSHETAQKRADQLNKLEQGIVSSL